jgi:oligopeptide transport system permease protein
MVAFFAKRIVYGVVTLFVIGTFCFFITRFAPGSPLTGEKNLPPEVMRNLERAYNLDRPLVTQYLMSLRGYLCGDLGLSFRYQGRRVDELIFPSFKTSIELGSLAFVLAMLQGMAIGLLAAAKHNRVPDYVSMSLALAGICIPNFLLGPVLVMIFCLWRPWLPVAGWPESLAPSEWLKLILPATTLSLVHTAYISRLMRAGILDVLGKDYIRTARAKGLAERRILLTHALKNGITPVLSYAGPMAAYVFTGSVVVEKIFNIPGMGQHFVDSALVRDYPMITGTMLVYSALVIGFNLLVDVGYSVLDPRVRLGA